MQKETEERIINPLYILLWLGLALWIGINHEPFADEAQAYLIARDAGVQDILSSVSRTEGTPALWFFWLKFLIFCGLGSSKLYLASIIPNAAAVYLFISKAPFPKYAKYIFPLTYFILYQYNIVARNYSLLFLMTILAAICFEKRKQHPYKMILSLVLLGSVSSHAFLLSCGIVLFWIYNDCTEKSNISGYEEFIKQNIGKLSLWGAFVILSVLYLYPDANNQYLQNYELLPGYKLRSILSFLSRGLVVSSLAMPENLLYIYMGMAYFLVMMYLLAKRYKIKFALIFILNIIFMLCVPYKPWHAGIILMSTMFLLWQEKEGLTRPLKIGISILFGVQILWSGWAVVTEINGKYAVTKEVYDFLQKENIKPQEVKLASFNGISLYLYESDKNLSYWDWLRCGFVQKITKEDIKHNKAIIINEEVYKNFEERVKEIQTQGNYQIKAFVSEHFFGLQDMSQDETLYVLYRK